MNLFFIYSGLMSRIGVLDKNK